MKNTDHITIKPEEYVQSLARGLAVIKAFSNDTPEMTLSEVAESTNLTRAAARRFLLTLQALGYVTSKGRRFKLTPRVLELGYAYLSSGNLWNIAEPFLEEVTEKTHESCSLSVLNDTDIVYVARIPTKRVMSISLNIGARLPAFCTSMGRVLLAELPEANLDRFFEKAELPKLTPHTETDPLRLRQLLKQVKTQGFCIVNQELELGLRSISVAVYNKRGEALAAMNIGAPAQRISESIQLQEFLPVLREAAEKIRTAFPQ